MTTNQYHVVPMNMTNNRAELSRLLEGFGLALIQTLNGSDEDIQVTLTSEGAITIATALLEVVNQMNKASSS